MKRAFVGLLALVLLLVGCSAADVARTNLEVAEQNFEVFRRVVF